MSAYAGYGHSNEGSPYAKAPSAVAGYAAKTKPLAQNPVQQLNQKVQGHGGGIGGWLGSKLSLAGHDIAQMPGGLAEIGNVAFVQPAKATYETLAGHKAAFNKTMQHEDKLSMGLQHGTVRSVKSAIEHPLRDPFNTALTFAPIVGTAGRLGEAGLAAKAADVAAGESRLGEAAKALVRPHGEQAPRVLKSGGRIVKSESGATMRIGKAREVNLIPSRNAGVRLAQRGYDKLVQNAMNKEAQAQGVGRVTSRIAEHGKARVGGALAEEQRAVQRMNATPADMLERSALKLSKIPLKAGGKLHSAALELTATQTPPEVAAAYHEAQALKLGRQAASASGKEAEQLAQAAQRNESVAALYRKVHENDLVHVDLNAPPGHKVFINPAKARLAKADAAMARAGSAGEKIVGENHLMSPEGQQQAINNPGLVRAGAEYVNPTPGKLGVESHVLKEARAQVAKLERLHARAALKAMGNPSAKSVVSQAPDFYNMPWEQSPIVGRLSSALSVAKDRLQTLEWAHENRIEPTGFVGGEGALPGRQYISYASSEKAGQPAVISAAQRRTIGEPQNPIPRTQRFTGENIRMGNIPKNVPLSVAKHYRQLAKFANTLSLRKAILESDGSLLKRSPRDILIRVPNGEARPLTDQMKQALGEVHSALHDQASLDEINAGTQQGLAALHQWLNGHILDQAEASRGAAIGTKAQKGYMWVDGKLVHQLEKDAAPRAGGIKSLPGKFFDNTNSAITAMTVYFKLGHVFTRGLTNAATNVMQGSLRPDQFKQSIDLWKSLSEEDKARAVAAAGQQGFAALPSEGSDGRIGRFISGGARGGSRFWARHFDAPFRFNSLAYELRKVGYGTPEKFHAALDAIQNSGHGMPAHEWSKVSAAFRRADREAISYDRLNEFEKTWLARAVWFYPWVKGSSLFTVRSILEHPWKSATLGQLGVQGREHQQNILGDVPSYEQGLIPLTGGKSPETVDMSTFSPAATLGQLLNIPEVKGAAGQQLNPALGSLAQYLMGVNSYGEPSNAPARDALSNLLSSTPEAQITDAIRRRGQNTSGRMFPGMNWKAELERYALGPGLAARRVNKAALAKAAAREHEKRYTVYSGG